MLGLKCTEFRLDMTTAKVVETFAVTVNNKTCSPIHPDDHTYEICERFHLVKL